MLSITPKPSSLTPILASTPYSVSVLMRPPSGSGMVQHSQLSCMSAYQSHVCTAIGARPAEVETTVEHSLGISAPSGAAMASSSVRALRAATCSTGMPAPAARPAISAAARGARSSMLRQARPPQWSRSKPGASRSKSRAYAATVVAIGTAWASPNSWPRP